MPEVVNARSPDANDAALPPPSRGGGYIERHQCENKQQRHDWLQKARRPLNGVVAASAQSLPLDAEGSGCAQRPKDAGMRPTLARTSDDCVLIAGRLGGARGDGSKETLFFFLLYLHYTGPRQAFLMCKTSRTRMNTGGNSLQKS